MLKIEAHKARAKAFHRDENGAAAIEFALVAPVLFFALLSLFEIGALGMMTSGLDNAVIDASRRIRTGRSDAATTASTFEQQICDRMGGAVTSCRDRLVVSVQKYSAFASASAAATSQPAGQFDKGRASDIILVKANYKWPLMSPFLATAYGRNGPMDITIASRVAFKNEPFE
ncbi:MAG: pilus assembly protein [Alphaproteobacteria bacterium]|nr:pilus assembly protein [Alphaproteobacteria bacterium]MBU1513715.1 pilus assembly protein [Alphaproteobacteria bacterium]MBU2094640.1 pilus assembly protein [Alphaproteobacteria bacterium]MBU2150291.1 pilus assembly protein [Alphaproteobacteria bacterium]MBU2309180.1 pilus assembly protein [Alphaproteobacteria bacterium]